jgi:hypothetical protein
LSPHDTDRGLYRRAGGTGSTLLSKKCMENWFHADTIQRRALQVTATMCECFADRLSASATEPNQEQVKAAGSACLDAVPTSEKAKLARPRT